MMKKFSWLLLWATIIFSFPSIFKGEEVSQTRGPLLGEKLTYALRWGVLPIGWATLHVSSIEEYEGHPVYHVVVKGWSNAFLSTFYKVRDYAETYIDVDGLFSWKFYKKQFEGGYQSEEVMEYDQNRHHAVYHSLKNGSMKEMDIPPKVQDTLSAIYLFRTLALKTGESVFMDVNADEKNWHLEIKVLDFKKDWEVRRLGIFDAFYVEPLAEFKGLVEKRGKVWVWISADRRRLPLLVKSKLPFGSVTATLVKVEVVRHDG
ncbi:MAG: DUF3108 domain-containing protein [Chlamydiae bacterium]|nr:DUF3108 domain-containing protein [Chlamydiota bacterium]MBI3277475.1 DUF3108 domain-containing protein [Chlamydiota bacterium]